MDFRQQMLLRHLSASAYSLDSTPSWERSCLYCCHLHVKEGRRAVDISHPACASCGLGKGEVLPVLSNIAQPFKHCL